jgi:hypothetical protein
MDTIHCLLLVHIIMALSLIFEEKRKICGANQFLRNWLHAYRQTSELFWVQAIITPPEARHPLSTPNYHHAA